MALQFTDKPTARSLPARSSKPTGILLHTTGDPELDKILRFYDAPDGFQPTYVVDYDGTLYRIAPEDRITWHAATTPAERALYSQGWEVWRRYTWRNGVAMKLPDVNPAFTSWEKRWRPGVESPLDLVPGAHPNLTTIGIEFRQPVQPGPAIFTDAQYAAGQQLVADVACRYGIALDQAHVLGHQDVSPLQRYNGHGGWDPGDAFDCSRILAVAA